MDTQQKEVFVTPLYVECTLPPARPRFETARCVLILLLAIGVKTWQPLAIGASAEKGFRYNKSAMVFAVEVVKFVFCSAVFFIVWKRTKWTQRAALTDLPFLTSLHFLVPSLFYAASNTLVYYSLEYLDPVTFQVFSNVRIIIVGLLYRVMMGRKNKDTQWLALVLLVAGAALVSPAASAAGSTDLLLGLLALAGMCCCSTGASIYSEIYYKKTSDLSIFYQNMVLYVYGMLVNGTYLLVTDGQNVFRDGLLYGFDAYAVQVLVVQTVMGISLSFIFKYLDNIVYVVALTLSMLLTAGLSMVFFDFKLSITFVCSVLIISIAIYLYYRPTIKKRFKLTKQALLF